MRITFFFALACWISASALAQTAAPAGDPQGMASRALAGDPGSATFAVWRDGHLATAAAQNAAPKAPLASGSGLTAVLPLFEIGSISKVFTGLLLAQAVERGDLVLDDTLGGLLHGEVKFSSPAVAAITLRQLITHSSCLPRQFGELGQCVCHRCRLDGCTLPGK